MLATLKSPRAPTPLVRERRGAAPDLPECAERLAHMLGASLERNRFGEHLRLRRWFSECIGRDTPGGVLDPAVRLLAPNAPKEIADPEQWLFLDTETAGTARATYAFLVGIAWWDAGGLEVEQLFMRDPSEEHSLLVALAERIAQRRVLVTFNGKAFDWPLLDARYRMTRAIRVPSPRAHLDFLHPARSLWRWQLGSARLTTLERHILGWNRGTDVISALIPQIYSDFLDGGPPEPLVAVFHHNQMDLRGLAGVAARVFALLGDPEKHAQDALELYSVSRICERRGEAQRAQKLYKMCLASELPPEIARVAWRSLARLERRLARLEPKARRT